MKIINIKMIGINDFKETLHTFFKKNNAVCKFDISHLNGFNIAIEDTMIIKNSRKANKNFCENIENFFAELKKFEINQITTISSGVDVINKDKEEILSDDQNPFFIYSKIQFLDNYLEVSEKKIKEFRKFKKDFEEVFFEDNLIISLLAEKYKNLIEKKSKKLNNFFLTSLVMKENQMAYLFENDFVDCIFASPLSILISEKPIFVIYEIDFKEKEFFYYSFEKLAENLEIEPDVLKKCLILSFLYFCTNENINGNVKISEALDFKNTNYKQNYFICIEKRIKIVEDHIELFKKEILPKISFLKLFKIASEAFNQDKSKLIFFYDIFFKIPIFSPNLDILFYPYKSSLSTKNYFPNHKKQELITFFCLNFINRDIFELVNKCNEFSHILQRPTSHSFEYDNLILNFYRNELELNLSKIIAIFKITLDQNEHFSLILNKIKINLNVHSVSNVMSSFFIDDLDPKKSSLTNIIMDFKKLAKDEKRQFSFNENSNISENQIIYYVYVKLLERIGFINKETKEIKEKSEFLIKIKKFRYEEEIIIFFLALENGLLDKESFLSSSESNFHSLKLDGKNLEEVNKQEMKNFIINFSVPKKKFVFFKNTNVMKLYQNLSKSKNHNYNYINNSLLETSKIFQKIVEKNKIPKDKIEIIKETILNSLNNEFHRIELLAKISIILLSDFNSTENFDFSCQQFSECLNLISQTLHSNLKTDLSFIFFKTNLNSNLFFIENLKKKLLFNINYSGSIGSIIKSEIIQFLIIEVLNKKYVLNCDFLMEEFNSQYFQKKYSINFSVVHFLKKIEEFLHNINFKFGPYEKKYQEIFENMKFARNLLKDFIKFIEENIN